jgi:hypothetical protein
MSRFFSRLDPPTEQSFLASIRPQRELTLLLLAPAEPLLPLPLALLLAITTTVVDAEWVAEPTI